MLPLAFRVCAAAAPCEETYYVKQALQSDRLQVPQPDRATPRQYSSNSTEQQPDSAAATVQQQQIDTYQVRIRIARDTYPAAGFGVSFGFANLYDYEQNSSGFFIYRPNHCSHPPRAHTIRRGFSSRIL